ncbi:MAG: GNAT family N-acetyltransferase, partial [Chthonomonadales bacterium]
MAITIRAISSDADRDACYLLRNRVFVDEQQVPPWEEMDAYDETALHFLAEDDGNVIGTARLVRKDEQTYKVGRVAIDREYRSKGIGRDLMWFVMSAGFQDCERLILDAQIQVIPFYERLGFVAEGP